MKFALLLFSGLFFIFAGVVGLQRNPQPLLGVLMIIVGLLAVLGSFLILPRPSGKKVAS